MEWNEKKSTLQAIDLIQCSFSPVQVNKEYKVCVCVKPWQGFYINLFLPQPTPAMFFFFFNLMISLLGWCRSKQTASPSLINMWILKQRQLPNAHLGTSVEQRRRLPWKPGEAIHSLSCENLGNNLRLLAFLALHRGKRVTATILKSSWPLSSVALLQNS